MHTSMLLLQLNVSSSPAFLFSLHWQSAGAELWYYVLAVLSSVEPALMEKYGNFEDVCASAELRDTFLELPLRMVEARILD